MVDNFQSHFQVQPHMKPQGYSKIKRSLQCRHAASFCIIVWQQPSGLLPVLLVSAARQSSITSRAIQPTVDAIRQSANTCIQLTQVNSSHNQIQRVQPRATVYRLNCNAVILCDFHPAPASVLACKAFFDAFYHLISHLGLCSLVW